MMSLMEKVEHNEELMEYMRGDPMFAAVKVLKLHERKKCMKRNNLCTGNIYCISTNKV